MDGRGAYAVGMKLRLREVTILTLVAVGCAPAPILRPDRPKGPRTSSEIVQTRSLDTAPGGVVTTREGGTFEISSAWAAAPAVVIFYRGHWCPHCQYQLAELNKRAQEFADRGATVLAISSDAPADLTVVRDKLGLSFELYSDASLEVIHRWGVEDFGNGIAKPATFIVKPGGEIKFQRVGDKPDDRPSVLQILEALDAPTN
jgi:peroxiredoxin